MFKVQGERTRAGGMCRSHGLESEVLSLGSGESSDRIGKIYLDLPGAAFTELT